MKRGVRRALIAAICGALVLAFAGLAGAKIKTKTFSTGTIHLTIPDPGTASHTFRSNKKRSKVKDVNIGLRISHDDAEDLLLSLTHRGRTVDLSSNNGGFTLEPEDEAYGSGEQGCDGTLTVFNDEAETAVAEADDPFVGQYVPEQPLSAFDGTKLRGDWTLTIEDYAVAFNGVLHCAELDVKYKKKKKRN